MNPASSAIPSDILRPASTLPCVRRRQTTVLEDYHYFTLALRRRIRPGRFHDLMKDQTFYRFAEGDSVPMSWNWSRLSAMPRDMPKKPWLRVDYPSGMRNLLS